MIQFKVNVYGQNDPNKSGWGLNPRLMMDRIPPRIDSHGLPPNDPVSVGVTRQGTGGKIVFTRGTDSLASVFHGKIKNIDFTVRPDESPVAVVEMPTLPGGGKKVLHTCYADFDTGRIVYNPL